MDTSLQNRAVWATGRHLEEIGANVSTFRLMAQAARVQVRASLAAVRPTATVVPDGAVLNHLLFVSQPLMHPYKH